MKTFELTGIIFPVAAGVLIAGVIFFTAVKYIQRKYYPSWKFPDYISVGYADYLYHRLFRRRVK